MPPKAGKGPDVPVTKALALPDLPPVGVWSADAQPRSAAALEDFSLYTPKGLFRNDYLAYCKILGIWPHPRLLPYEAEVELPSESKSAVHVPTWRAAAAAAPESKDGVDAPQQQEEPPRQYFDFSICAEVAVRGCSVGPWDLVALSAALRTATHVDTLAFSNAGLNALQVFELARVLPTTSVRALHVDFNPLEDPHIVTSVGGVGAGSSAAPAGGPVHLAALTAEPGETHRSVTTTGVAGRAKFVHVFAQLARRGSKLTRLSLRGNNLSAADGAAIADAVRFNPALRELILGHNRLGDDGAAAVLEGVRDQRTAAAAAPPLAQPPAPAPPRFLSLAENGLSPAAVPAIAAAVSTYTLSAAAAKLRAQLELRVVGELAADPVVVASVLAQFAASAPGGAGGAAAAPPNATVAAAIAAAAAAQLAPSAGGGAASSSVAGGAVRGVSGKKGGGGAAKEEADQLNAVLDALRLPPLRIVRAAGAPPPPPGLPPTTAVSSASVGGAAAGAGGTAPAGGHTGSGGAVPLGSGPSAAKMRASVVPPSAVGGGASAAGFGTERSSVYVGGAGDDKHAGKGGSGGVGGTRGSTSALLTLPDDASGVPLWYDDEYNTFVGDGNRELAVLDLSGNPELGLEGLGALAAVVTPATYVAALKWHEAALQQLAQAAAAAAATAASEGGGSGSAAEAAAAGTSGGGATSPGGPGSPSSPRSSIASSYISHDIAPPQRRPPHHNVPPVPIAAAAAAADSSAAATNRASSLAGPKQPTAPGAATAAASAVGTATATARTAVPSLPKSGVASGGTRGGAQPQSGKTSASGGAAAAAAGEVASPEPPAPVPPATATGLTTVVAGFCVGNVGRTALPAADAAQLRSIKDVFALAGCALVVP